MRFAVTVIEYDEFSNEVQRFNLFPDAIEVIDTRTKVYKNNPYNPEKKKYYEDCKITIQNMEIIKNDRD